MLFRTRPSQLAGDVHIPGSKSHTIRGVLLASLAAGESRLIDPLASSDTEAAVRVYGQLGAEFELGEREWRIRGTGLDLQIPDQPLDVGNSGTTMNVSLGTTSLIKGGALTLTGDHQIQRRPSAPLVQALQALGASIKDLCGTGCPPYEVAGGLRGLLRGL